MQAMIRLHQEKTTFRPISYLRVVSTFLHHLDELYGPDAIFHWIDPGCLVDTTKAHRELNKELGSDRSPADSSHVTSPLDELLEPQHTYAFTDSKIGPGYIFVSFRDATLVCAELGLLFFGSFANLMASSFTNLKLRPVISRCLGEDDYRYDEATSTYSNANALRNYFVTYESEPAYPTVHTWIKHKSWYS